MVNIPEQEHILNTHINTLREWWSEAEHAPFREGDTLIARFDDRPMPFEVYPAGCASDVPAENVRILARAPKPQPAWHDAVAVIAHIGGNELPRVLVRDNDGAFVDGLTGHAYAADRLRDPAPLIEAKVTDEARDRVWRELVHYNLIDPTKHRPSDPWTADVVHVALGLETS